MVWLLGLLTVTFILPYLYFINSESFSLRPIAQRIARIVIFSLLSGCVVLIVYVAGVFIPHTALGDDPTNPARTRLMAWVGEVVSTNWLERGYEFLREVVTLFGDIFLLTYSVYGMADVGVSLLKGDRDDVEVESTVLENIQKVTDEMNEFEELHRNDVEKRKMSRRKYGAQMARYRARLRKLTSLQTRMTGPKTVWGKVLNFLRGFGVLFGLFFTLFATVIIVSLFVTLVVAVVKSSCGFSCGFVLDDPGSVNPMDLALRMLGAFFPLDYMLFGCVILFFVYSTIHGIRRIGIRFIWIKLFDLKAKETSPQALLLAAAIVTFATYAFCGVLVPLAPFYSTFGNQQDTDNTQCSLQSPPTQCRLSVLGSNYLQISFGYNYFAVTNYVIGWLFCIGWGVSIGISYWRNNKRQTKEIDLDELL